MFWQIVAIVGGLGTLIAALWLAGKNGSKAAKLEALKAELKKQAAEQERAQRITDKVYSLTPEEARRKLTDIANKSR